MPSCAPRCSAPVRPARSWSPRPASPATATARTRPNRVFGSAARGDARPDSDIDLLVDFDAERYGLGPLAGFRAEVRDLLDRDVDVATLALLREDVRVEAEAQAVPL